MIKGFWLAILAWFVCTEQEARGRGMTHECTFLGVAHWLRWVEDDEMGQIPHLIPKISALTLWLWVLVFFSDEFLIDDVRELPETGAEEVSNVPA